MAQVQLDDNLLDELGLGDFSESEKEALLKSIYEGLELRMGIRVAEVIGNDKLSEFNDLTNAGRDDEARQWLRDNVPDYQDIANEELEKFKKEVQDTSRKVLEKSI